MEPLSSEQILELNTKIDQINKLHSDLFVSTEDRISVKENIDNYGKELTRLTKEAKIKFDSLNEFYETTLLDNGDVNSTKTEFGKLLEEFASQKQQLIQDIELISKKKQEQLDLIEDLSSFHHKTLVGSEEEISTKDNIDAVEIDIVKLKNDAENKVDELNKFYNTTLIDEDDFISTKSELNNLLEEFTNKKNRLIDDAKLIEEKKQTQIELIGELSSFHNEAFSGSEENTSIKEQLDTFLEEYEGKNVEITEKQSKFNEFYSEIFKGTDEKKSLKDDFNFTLLHIKKQLSDSEKELSYLNEFHDKVIDKEDPLGETKIGLSTTVSRLKDQLQTLINDAEKKLYAITDSSLHNAFAVRAESYTKEFQKLQKYTFFSILGLIIDLVVFGGVQVGLNIADKPFSYNILIYQFSIAGSLLIAIWMFNRNQKMAKKLAEEYHHKASISEAMTGYRSLYSLDHEDEEYQQLFNSIKDQLNINPSKHIDSFLKLKSPQEEVTGIAKELLNPQNLGKLAKQLKPLMDKV